MAIITRLRTRPDRLRADQAAMLRQALLPFADGDMAPHVQALVSHIDRETAASNGWTFVMISPTQYASVVRHLVAHSSRPLVAVQVWALAFEHLDIETGEIGLTRDQIADAVGERPEHISRVMSELEDVGAITRRRERIAGMRGQGRVLYFVNPRVGTHTTGQARDKAQAKAPQLRLV